MIRSIRAIGLAAALTLTGSAAPFGLAQDAAPPAAAPQASQELIRVEKGLIEETLQLSHAAEIYADLRRTLAEVYIPLLRDTVQGDLTGAPAPDPKMAAALAKALTFLDYVRRAGDEIDGALIENREAMISEAAGVAARYSTPSEAEDLGRLLRSPAARKGFDALYALTRLLTGFSYEDSKTFAEFSYWADGLKFDFSKALPGAQGAPASPPSPARIAKAGALVNDFLKISRVDDMIARVKLFVRDVYVEAAPLSEEERQALRDQIDQFDFTYNLQRSIALAAAPSVIAAALNDEQLATLHTFVRSPACARAFDLTNSVVELATAFTKDDILSAQKSIEELKEKSKQQDLSGQADQIAADWSAYAQKWSDALKNSLSPETRSGLEQSWEALEASEEPI